MEEPATNELKLQKHSNPQLGNDSNKKNRRGNKRTHNLGQNNLNKEMFELNA